MGELLQSKPDGFASSLGEGAFGKEEKLYRTAKGPISEGAVTEGDWGREFKIFILSLRLGLRRATSLTEGGFEYRSPKAKNPRPTGLLI